MARFIALLEPGMTVYDIGAHVGYYTLVASRAVGREGHVIAFEPNPKNIRYLQRHVELNGADNVRIVEAAVAAAGGVAIFEPGENSALGRLQPTGRIRVPLVSLDLLVNDGKAPPPDVIKMDIEGGEAEALRGGLTVLRHYRPSLLLATHGDEVHGACVSLLREVGYALEPIDASEVGSAHELVARHGWSGTDAQGER